MVITVRAYINTAVALASTLLALTRSSATAEIANVCDHYSFQGHSMSPILVRYISLRAGYEIEVKIT